MKAKLGRIAAAVLALGLVSGPAAAQLQNHPVYFSPVGGTGLTIAGDFGAGVNDDAKFTAETPFAYGGRVTLGLPIVRITAGASVVDPRGTLDAEIALGGNIAVNVLKATPITPVAVSIQGGVGYIQFSGSGVTGAGVNELDFPIGVGVAIDVPSPAVSVEPWAAPRIHITRISNGTSQTEIGFGASGGLNIGLPGGLGFHAALDWRTIDFGGIGGSDQDLVVGIGLHYTFTIPGLGIPVVPGM